MQLKAATMRSDEWTGTDSLRPFGARVKCNAADMTVEYRLDKFQFDTEAVAISFAVQLCAYPFEVDAWREAVGIYDGSRA